MNYSIKPDKNEHYRDNESLPSSKRNSNIPTKVIITLFILILLFLLGSFFVYINSDPEAEAQIEEANSSVTDSAHGYLNFEGERGPITLEAPPISDTVTYSANLNQPETSRIEIPGNLIDMLESGVTDFEETLSTVFDPAEQRFVEYVLDKNLGLNDYTVEIMRTPNADEINQYLAQHALSNHQLYLAEDNQHHYVYVLVKGKFLTRQDAEAAKQRLASLLKRDNLSILQGKTVKEERIIPNKGMMKESK